MTDLHESENTWEHRSRQASDGSFPRGMVVLVVGPESSGTRKIHDVIQQHPLVLGSPNALKHEDHLDEIWKCCKANDIDNAAKLFTALPMDQVILSRRSLPHGETPGIAASYMGFPDLHAFKEACDQARRPLCLLVTTRSPAPHLASWTLSRASTAGKLENAAAQYWAAYKHIFHFAETTNTPFFIVSLEALFLDGIRYLASLYMLLGLPHCDVRLDTLRDPNSDRYDWYFQNGPIHGVTRIDKPGE